MTIEARRQYISALRERYPKAKKKEKTVMLNEFCAICGYKSRKHAIRLANGKLPITRQKQGRKQVYGAEVQDHLIRLWETMTRMYRIWRSSGRRLLR